MTDDSIAEMARVMKVTEALAELQRQGVAEALADLGFDPVPLVRAVIRAADGDVVVFPGRPSGLR
jgi:hypothetical protein